MNKAPWWVWALGIGGVAYFLYKAYNKLPTVPSAAQLANKVIDFLSLPFINLPPAMQVLGNVTLPNGTLVPLNTLQSGQIRQDETVNPPAVYASVQGSIYQLAPSDANGNFPATYVMAAPPGA